MNILITGADGNLGQAVARKFLAEGHQVFGTMLPGQHQEELEEHGAFRRLEADLMHEGPLSDAMAGLGVNLHVAVFTVGGFGMGTIESAALSDLDKMLKLNVHTAFVSTKAMFAHMKAHGEGGRMVLVSSKPGLDPKQGTGVLPYALSKAAIPALADILNVEGKEHDIVTAVIAPSIIDTPPNREAMPKADFSQWVTPAEIANVIFFATTDQGKILREPVLKLYGEA
jgi:NAD(P)-dependent dehydrogenase (short-subunit alcohol dehydrogenase family)